jgi:hypothetical protein
VPVKELAAPASRPFTVYGQSVDVDRFGGHKRV